MNTLRERVARRLCCGSWHDDVRAKEYMGCDCVAWKDWLLPAAAAIAEILAALRREPSDEMAAAGSRQVRNFYSESGLYPRTKAMWAAMVAERLKEWGE